MTAHQGEGELLAPERLLFKYRSDNEFTERIFVTRRVWLSTASELNDPFECSLKDITSDWIREQTYQRKASQILGIVMGMRKAVEAGKSYCGVSSRHAAEMLESVRVEEDFDTRYRILRAFHNLASGTELSDPGRPFAHLDDDLNSVGIFSMSESPDDPLMWAHYGGNHTGICLGFRGGLGGETLDDPKRCLPVRYTSEVPRVPEGGLETELSLVVGANGKMVSQVRVSFSDPTLLAAITTKGESWSYEREWRYVERLGGEYPWPGPLAEITFGLRCPDERREHYAALARQYASGDVRLFEMVKVPNSNELRRAALRIVVGERPSQSLSDDYAPAKRIAAPRVVGEHVAQLARCGSFDEVLEIVTEQLKADPDYYPALCQKAIALGYTGRHEDALALFERCGELHPEDPDVWFQQGVALSELGRKPEAIEAYQKAHALNPADASSALNLGVELARCGFGLEARKYLLAAQANGHPRAAAWLEQLSDASLQHPASPRTTGAATPSNTGECPCGSGLKFKKCHGRPNATCLCGSGLKFKRCHGA